MPNWKRAVLPLLCAVTFLLNSAPAHSASGGRRSVTGTVVDQRGNALPGASVRIEDTRTLAIASYITRQDGHYYFHQLDPDTDYTLTAKYKRWWSKAKMLSKFNEKKEATIDLQIPLE